MSPRAQTVLDFWFVDTPSEKRFKKDPWIDTEIIYKRLYPQSKNYKLENLAKEFLDLANISNEVKKYSPNSIINFHNPLYDAFCCFYLIHRLHEAIDLRKFCI